MSASQYTWLIVLLQPPSGQSGNSRGRSIFLQAALLSAATAFRLIILHMDMSDFTAAADGSCQNFTLHDNAAAHSGSQSYRHYVFMALAGALPHFAKSRHISVIARLYRYINICLHRLGYVKGSPCNIGTATQIAFFIHCAGNAYADSHQILLADPLFFHFSADTFYNIRKDGRSFIVQYGGNLPLVQNISLFIKETQLNRGSPDVYTKRILTHDFPHLSFLFFYSSSSSRFLAREFCTLVYSSCAAL